MVRKIQSMTPGGQILHYVNLLFLLSIVTEDVQKSTPPKKNLVKQKKISEKLRKRSVPTAITPEKQKNGHEVIKNLKSKGNKSLKTSQGKVQNAIIIEGDMIEI